MSDSLFPRFGREFRTGEVLFREGDKGEVMYVVQTGVVRISKMLQGHDRTLATFGRGEFIGEMAILNSKPRTATATIVEDAKLLVIDGRTLETMIATSSEIAFRLIKKLARRLDAVDELVQILMNPDPEARVMLGLKRHAESFGEEGASGEIVLHVSPAELAMEVGAKPAHVHDVLRRLGRLHIAGETQDGTIMVADVGRLLEFLEFVDVPRSADEEGSMSERA
jgi:CRP/FNR family cyclic AMP-dependent transcriptional regulator